MNACTARTDWLASSLGCAAKLRVLASRGGVLAVAAGVALLFGLSPPALAQKSSCQNRPNVLGTSRIIEVDTKGGILLGNQQYKSVDFLKPGEVVLTFDDGPLRRNTLKVLNALEAHCTKATFFMVGRMAVSDPAMVREIDRRGHTVGTHTWSHKNLARLSRKSAEKEIELGISAVSAALGRPAAPFFRFPYLSDPNVMIEHLGDRNIGTFSIDGDAFDYKTRSGLTVQRQILRALKKRGKGILLFHDIQKSTAKGLMSLLGELRDRGYKIVHLVPKETTRTLASYDKLAARRLARSAKSAAERPLANRSIVWPISEQQDIAVEPLVNKGPVIARRSTTRDQDLPWLEEKKKKRKTTTEKNAAKKRAKTTYRKRPGKRYKRQPAPRRQPSGNNGWSIAPFWFD